MAFLRMTDLDLQGKRVFIRADLNVPQDDAGNIADDTRIRAAVPGIRHALDAGARVMVTSHLGRPKEGEFRPEDSLAPVAKRLAELLGVPAPVKANWVDAGEVAPPPGELVGGGIANTFMLAVGGKIGRSLAEPQLVEEARRIVRLMEEKGGAVPIPIDVVCAKELAPTARAELKTTEHVAADDLILDVGRQTARAFEHFLKAAGTIVWNGPVGVFEYDQFGEGTRTVANAIAESGAFSLAGGGETIAAIRKYGVADRISYISTGGGAFLEFLEGRKLPAIAILEQRARG